jgi:hypothetical protein
MWWVEDDLIRDFKRLIVGTAHNDDEVVSTISMQLCAKDPVSATVNERVPNGAFSGPLT